MSTGFESDAATSKDGASGVWQVPPCVLPVPRRTQVSAVFSLVFPIHLPLAIGSLGSLNVVERFPGLFSGRFGKHRHLVEVAENVLAGPEMQWKTRVPIRNLAPLALLPPSYTTATHRTRTRTTRMRR